VEVEDVPEPEAPVMAGVLPDADAVPEASEARSDAEDLRLWQQYKATQNVAIRERLILKYASFVKYIAGRMAIHLPSNVDFDDLVSYGVFGLLDAIEKFDPARQVKFKTYAKTRIRGAILDELRVLDWTPRSIRQKAKHLEKSMLELESRLGREPSDEELAAHMKTTVKELHKLFEETNQSLMMSLDEGDPEGDGNVSRKDFLEDVNLVTPEKSAERNDLKRILAEEITRLSERERMVVTLYYYEQLTSKEIGKILGVSDSRISQLHTKAILRLRGRLAKSQELVTD
jgi:RNA polymerase sigma factor for flagellar operon FliA